MLQRSVPNDTSMRRFGQFTPNQSPATASSHMPPMSPPAEALRPSSVPILAAAQNPPPPPPPVSGPPKKSSIMDLLNNDSEPQPRKRLSDQQRPAAPTPPPPQASYQAMGQPMQLPLSRREASSESLSHLQQQQRSSFNHHLQQQSQSQPQQQQSSQLREPTRDWASAAQQVGTRPWTEERPAPAHSAFSPPPQASYVPTSSRAAFQPLQRNHVPSPPPFSHPTHSRTPSFTNNVQPAHHPPQPQQQTAVPSTPAEPNIRPSPYASLTPHAASLQAQQQPLRIQQVMLEQQQRQEQDYRLQQQQQELMRRQEHDRHEMMMRQRREQVRREQDERDRRGGRPSGAGYYGEGGGISGRGLGGGYEERR